MKKAVIKVSKELLQDLLLLPEGISVLAVRETNLFNENIEVMLSGDGLPDECECKEGERALDANLWHKTRTAECGCRKVEFDRIHVYDKPKP